MFTNSKNGGGLTNKAFTLIELLAVIIILAVIALIATPIVLNVVEQAQRKANLQSVNGLLDGAKYYYTESLLDLGMQSKMDGHTNIIDDIKVNGDKPTNGHLYMNASGQTELQVVYKNRCYTKSFSDSKVIESDDVENCGAIDYSCRATQGTGSNLGDVITCGSESFYVLSNNGTDIRMLSKYNLKVGYVETFHWIEEEGDLLFSGETEYTEILPSEPGYGLQSSEGNINEYFLNGRQVRNGITAFSNTGTTYSGSIAENYVNAYKDKLISFNIPVKEATLINNSELEGIVGRTISIEDEEFLCDEGPEQYCSSLKGYNSNIPEWLYGDDYSYYAMSYVIHENSRIRFLQNNTKEGGIRPVIVIPVTALK